MPPACAWSKTQRHWTKLLNQITALKRKRVQAQDDEKWNSFLQNIVWWRVWHHKATNFLLAKLLSQAIIHRDTWHCPSCVLFPVNIKVGIGTNTSWEETPAPSTCVPAGCPWQLGNITWAAHTPAFSVVLLCPVNWAICLCEPRVFLELWIHNLSERLWWVLYVCFLCEQ